MCVFYLEFLPLYKDVQTSIIYNIKKHLFEQLQNNYINYSAVVVHWQYFTLPT